jgi:hypothetical protein
MDSFERSVPVRRRMPVFVALLLAVLVALGLMFVWPW